MDFEVLSKENLDAFIERVNDFTESTYDDALFERVIEVEDFITETFSLRQMREIALLEPCGIANKKPLFALELKTANATRLKPDSNHVTINGSYIDMLYFGGASSLELLQSDVSKTIVFEPNLSTFNNRDYVKGYVKNVVTNNECGKDTYLRALIRSFSSLAFKNYENAKYLTKTEILDVLANEKPSGYGVMMVISNPENLSKYDNLGYSINYLKLNEKAGKNVIIVGGIPEDDGISNYHTLVYLDTPLLVDKYVNFKQVIVCSDVNAFNLSNLICDRLEFGKIFKSIVNSINVGNAKTPLEMYGSLDGVSLEQFAFALSVFIELEFITYNGAFRVNSSVKKDLSTSNIYTKVQTIISKE